MSYPGNQSLPADVQQRIRSTFEHTLTLASSGNRQEAILGCEFVLRMDPHFEPARRLQERLGSGNGPVAVDDLAAQLAGRPVPPAAGADELFADFDPLAVPELPDLAEEPHYGAGLEGELQRLFAERRFQELLNRARQDSAAVAASPELRRLTEQAEERLEAAPYVNKFLSSTREMLLKGDRVEAGRLLDKARSLDASHPGIAEISSQLAMAPPPPPPPASADGIDFSAALASDPGFSLPGMSGAGGDEPRIQELLQQGQAAFEAGDPQGAIDVWSRIFLIDIDNREASRRIEGARRQKAERERQAEEIFHDGVDRMGARDLAGARHAFEQVLVLQPEHLGAREYLEQLARGEVLPFPGAKPAPAGAGENLLSGIDGTAELRQEILIPPDPVKSKAAAKGGGAARRAAAGSSAKRRFILLGAAVLLLVAFVGFYLYSYRETIFPNSQPEPVAAPHAAAAPDPLAKAKSLHANGKSKVAIAQLRRLPPSAPQYAEAQKLIAEWEKEGIPAAAPAPGAELTGESAARRDKLLAEARQYFAERRYLKAEERFNEASRIAKLEDADAAASAEARHQLEPIARQIALVRKENEWETALPELWKLYQADSSNQDVRQLIVDSYYNLGVRDLQRNDAKQAIDQFGEALKLDPRDALVERYQRFAQAYKSRDKDLLYRIYVKYLPSR